MKLKETLQMPGNKLNMKANLANKEPIWQQEWVDQDVYNEIMKKNQEKPLFVLHDGPPYANGDIHLGHALNKILKDMITRYKNANGFNAPMIYGWDTHGLPIENALLKNGKIKRNEMSDLEFRKLCAKYADEQINSQKEQFKTLGLLTDFNEFYETKSPDFEASQIEIFSKMVEKGLIYKGLKPVYWSPTSQSALAEAEIEYQDKVSPAIYVAMKLIDFDLTNTSIVIWTTTPWTIPANFGVAVGEDFSYSVLETKRGNLIVATDLVEEFVLELTKKDVELGEVKVIKTLMGSELEGISIKHPLYEDRITKIMLGHHVTIESGTGCVHIAPGHGEDDFLIGKKYGIETISVVDAFGKMNDNARDLSGMFYEDANKEIGMRLEANGTLLALSFLKHSYPHDWRTKKPVIFRATAQWFANIDPVKRDMLTAINEVEYAHEWAQTRLYNMIDGRNEWCISRQRKWGVPIPIFYTQKEEPILDVSLIDHVGKLFAEFGSDIWFEKSATELLPTGYTHPDSPEGIFTKETDIMDVWFDSGTSYNAVVNKRIGTDRADLYLEGSDQYRGWFNSSLITSFIANGHAPYKQLVSHGFTLDGKGLKMSKSIGNTIVPKQITSTKGADILRLWVASVDYSSDVRASNDIISQVSELYRRYRNTLKFILGTVDGFEEHLELSELNSVDLFMLKKLSLVVKECENAYDKYEFKKVLDTVNNFITQELSSFYMDFIKDITYVDHKDSKRRQQILTTLSIHADVLIKIMMPILPHTTYEAYKLFSGENVLLTDYPVLNIELDDDIYNTYCKFLVIRDDINKAIEEKRNEKIIGKSLSATINMIPTADARVVLEKMEDLDLLLIVSEFNIVDSVNNPTELASGSIEVIANPGCECARCRKYYDETIMTTIKFEEIDNKLCTRCEEVVQTYL